MNFRIKPADTFIWNLSELVDFLIANQNQPITIDNGTEGACAHRTGLYQWLDKFKFSHVTVKTSNVLEHHKCYSIDIEIPWKFLNVTRPISSNWHVWNHAKVFGTLYGRPLWHRLGITSHLLEHHANISHVGFTTDPNNQDRRELFELVELWKHSPIGIKNFGNIYNQLPLLHADVDAYTPGAFLTDGFVAQTERIYQHFLIDIVAETFISGNCFFVTEKTVRPMLLKKPMIVMGSKNYLAYLRQMGFRTFADFWDEEYDGYEGADRFIRILGLIDSLAAKTTSELENMYWDMQYTLDHNYNLLISQKYKKHIKEL
jgi:hypothetical protein